MSEARSFSFTSESVTEGHPDKIADQISDSVLDAVLKDDVNARVACETLITTGLVVVAGEITTETWVDVRAVVRERIAEIGYTRAKYGFDYETCGVMVAIDEQSSDIAQGVDESYEAQHGDTDPLDLLGAGVQLRDPGAGRRAARPSTQARDPDSGVALVPLVEVDDDGRQALECASARERAGVERASGGEQSGELERSSLRVDVVAADEDILVGRGVAPRLDAASEGSPATTGASTSARIRSANETASVVGNTPSFEKLSSDATDNTGVEPIDWRSSRAVSSAASAVTARMMRRRRRLPRRSSPRRSRARAPPPPRAPRLGTDDDPRDPTREGVSPTPCRTARCRRRSLRACRVQDELGEAALGRAVGHERLRHDEVDVRLGGPIRLVDHERIDETAVALGHVSWCRAACHASEHTGGRAGDGRAADERAHRDTTRQTSFERVANRGDGQNGSDREIRVARGEDDDVR